VSHPPEACAVAFKEWHGVCEALLEGRQTIIVRKGGVDEVAGPGAFTPEHAEFWLYPTWVHQAEQGLRIDRGAESATERTPSALQVPIRALVRAEVIGRIDSERALPAIEEFHIYTPETILKRFHYRRPGIWVLTARVWSRETSFSLAVTPAHAGCKSWVVLDPPLPTSGLTPVLEEGEWSIVGDRLRSILGTRGAGARA
jgi:hypothetical protein